MRTHRIQNRRPLGILAPAIAVWTFLTLVSGVQAQAQAPAPAPEAVEANWGAQTLRASIWLNKNSDEVYRRGEPVNVTFQTNEDAYAVVYHIDVDGLVSVLWPTSRFNDGFVFGGHQYRLPARGGERMRAGSREGQGFFHTVVSQYPFDLRDLELDFHHEEEAVAQDFYVAGDPYLAMNEVNFAVTGLEDSSEYAVSNFVSYYVHRAVDHPRYMCFQCHDGEQNYDPYDDHCTITIEADYSWVDSWWDEWGYFPTYVMPVYVYVDPWNHDHWVNYWYRPWYRWPSWGHSHWHYTCWDWHHSPYWWHDAYSAHGHGHTRHRPLDRRLMERARTEARTKNTLVSNRRPTEERIRRMKDRTVAERIRTRDDRTTDSRIRGAGGTIKKTDRTRREQQRYDQVGRDNRQRTSPGLRVGKETIHRPGTSGRAPTRVGRPTRDADDRSIDRGTTRRGDSPQTIKPVNPRNSGGVWSNRRNQGSSTQRPTPPPRSQTGNRRSTEKPKVIDRSRGTSQKPRSVDRDRSTTRSPKKIERSRNTTRSPKKIERSRSSSSNKSNKSRSTVQPRSSGKSNKSATPPPSRNSSGSSGRSKSSGSSKAKKSSGGRG